MQGLSFEGLAWRYSGSVSAGDAAAKTRSAWNVIYSNTFRPLGKGKSWRPAATLLENPLAQNGTDRFNGQQIEEMFQHFSRKASWEQEKLLDSLD
jgi:hypothetical protein